VIPLVGDEAAQDIIGLLVRRKDFFSHGKVDGNGRHQP
jgi:hypothetical protein